MIKGHMDLQRFDARGLTEKEILIGIDEMGLDRFLEQIHKNGHWRGNNRILVGLARVLYYAGSHSTSEGGWLNAPNPGSAYDGSSNPLLCSFHLASTSDEKAVTYSWSSASYNAAPPNLISPGKRFDTDGIVDVEVYKDPNDKEAVIVRQKFMWLPGEATSSAIRSVLVTGGANDSIPPCSYCGAHTVIAQWRIKDSGGNPVTLTKLDQEVLLLSYTFTMYSK